MTPTTRRCGISLSALGSLEHTFPIYSNICLLSAASEWITRGPLVFDFHTPHAAIEEAMTIIFVRLRPVWHWRGAHLTSARMASRVKIDWYGSYNGLGVFIYDARLTHFSYYLRRHGAFIEIERLVSPLSQYLQHTFRVQKINGQRQQLLASDADKLWEKSYVSFIDAKENKKQLRWNWICM